MHRAKAYSLFPTQERLLLIEKTVGSFVSDEDPGVTTSGLPKHSRSLLLWTPLSTALTQDQSQLQKYIDLARRDLVKPAEVVQKLVIIYCSSILFLK
jgi:hypothetical protein